MKNASSIVLAICAGYLLGRKRRLRLAAAIAAAAASGKLGGLASQAIKRGGDMLGSSDLLGSLSPELGQIATTVRGDLTDAGKAAAQAALTSRIESLTESLHERAEALRSPAEAAVGQGEESPSDRESPDDRHRRPHPDREHPAHAHRERAAQDIPRPRRRDVKRADPDRRAREPAAGDRPPPKRAGGGRPERGRPDRHRPPPRERTDHVSGEQPDETERPDTRASSEAQADSAPIRRGGR